MKVLKLDLLYPSDYLESKQLENLDFIDKMKLDEYVAWIHSLQIGYGDVITSEFQHQGWEVYEYYNQDDIFIDKLLKQNKVRPALTDLLNSQKRKDFLQFPLQQLIQSFRIKERRKTIKKEIILKRYIESLQPDIIFLREPCQVNNLIFKEIKKRHLIVTMIGCNVAHAINWLPHNSDIIFTIFPHYKTFFDSNGIESHLFEYGVVDLSKRISMSEKKYDISFIGLLGTAEQSKKTVLMEKIAGSFPFQWWGPQGDDICSFPNLQKTWNGTTAGKDMYEIYNASKIVVNDYVDTANGQSINMRVKEVLSIGSFLLTRNTKSVENLNDAGALVTFSDDEDCLDKLKYYLMNEVERELISAKGMELGEQLFSSRPLMKEMKELIEKKYHAKFKTPKNISL